MPMPGVKEEPAPRRRRWSFRAPSGLIGLAALAGLAAALVFLLRPAGPGDSARAAPAVGHPAPVFALPTMGGGTADLRRFLGRPLLLQFWAVDCTSCAAERADLLRASRPFQASGGLVLGVDAYLEPPDLVRGYVRTHPEPYDLIWLDPDGAVVFGRYRIVGVPTSFFIDRQGTIRTLHVGQMTQGQISRALHGIEAPGGEHTS